MLFAQLADVAPDAQDDQGMGEIDLGDKAYERFLGELGAFCEVRGEIGVWAGPPGKGLNDISFFVFGKLGKGRADRLVGFFDVGGELADGGS